jgi:hypothetical protein
MEAFMPIYQQFTDAVDRFTKMQTSGDQISWQQVFEASHEFPPLLQSLKSIPKPPHQDLRKIRNDFRLALLWWGKVGKTSERIVKQQKSAPSVALLADVNKARTYTRHAAKRHKAVVDGLNKIGKPADTSAAGNT